VAEEKIQQLNLISELNIAQMHNPVKSLLIFLLILLLPLAGQSQQVETVVQAGHYAPVTAVCFSPDGNFSATGSEDKTIILWHNTDGKQIRSFRGSQSSVVHLEFNSQGTALLSLGRDGSCIVWDINTGKILAKMKPENYGFTCASLSPDGTKIVTGSRKSGISVWDIATGGKSLELKPDPRDLFSEKGFDYPESGSVSFSRDGKLIVAGSGDNTAILFDAATGKDLMKYKKTFSTCTSCIIEAAITSDNKYIIITGSDSLKMFDRVSGKQVREFYGQGGSPEDLTISIDNKLVSAIEYGVAEVWDINSGKILFKAGDYSENKILAASFSPDGRRLLTGSEKRKCQVWDIGSGKEVLSLRGYLNQVDEKILTNPYMYWAAFVNEARLSPDGKFIAVGRSGNTARLIDFRTGKVFKTLSGHNAMVISLCFSRDAKLLATGGVDGKAIVWDVETGKPVREFSSPDEHLAIFSLDISNDRKMLATADWGGDVTIRDIESGKTLRVLTPHSPSAAYQVKFSANDVYVITAGLDRKLTMTEIDSGEEIREFKGHTDLVNSIDLNKQGDKIISAGLDGTIRVWDFLSGIQLLRIRAHQGGAYCARFDPSGKYIVSGGDDFLIKEWDAATGAMVCELAGHQGGVGDVNITDDHKYIISGSRDGSVRIWNVTEKRELVSMIFLNENDWFIRNPGGYFDASEGAFKSISFVKGTEIFSISQFFNEFYRPGLYSEAIEGNNASYRQSMMQTIEKYPPPDIEFVLPENGSTEDSPGITCMVKVTNRGGGVKEFRVMHNGKRQIVDASDLQRMSKAGQEAMKTFEIGLVPGDNEITVSAFSNGDIESTSKSINIIYKGLQKESDCYVLSIGINKYENESQDLTYAKPDAQAFSSFMNSKGGKLFNKVHSYLLTDKDATKDKIISTIGEISKTIKKEDVFIFFYAGHGSSENNLFYFITSEITGLYQEEKLKSALCVTELEEKFKMIAALKQVVFIDACQSGSSVQMLAMRGATEEKALAQLSRSSGVHVMASSESDQQSAEIKSLGHGVFTYVLLEALNGKADGAPVDSKVTVYEIKSYIDDQVPEVSYNLIRHKQFPSTFSIGHDFPIAIE
jgi:WD40 repeat protein